MGRNDTLIYWFNKWFSWKFINEKLYVEELKIIRQISQFERHKIRCIPRELERKRVWNASFMWPGGYWASLSNFLPILTPLQSSLLCFLFYYTILFWCFGESDDQMVLLHRSCLQCNCVTKQQFIRNSTNHYSNSFSFSLEMGEGRRIMPGCRGPTKTFDKFCNRKFTYRKWVDKSAIARSKIIIARIELTQL